MNSSITVTRRAFTLVEILVVIVIIALLAAILFPVFGKVREKAQQSTCTSNLKQIYSAMRLYNQDYDGKYPAKEALGSAGFRAVADQYSMPSLMQPYTKNDQIWFCPGEYQPHREAGYPAYWWPITNTQLLAPDQYEDGNASSAQWIIQENYVYKTPANFNSTGSTGQTQWPKGGKYCAHVSNTNFNYLGFDGRVKLMPWDKVQSTAYCGKL